MGQEISTSISSSISLESILDQDLPDFQLQKTLGNGRVLKTVLAANDNLYYILKVYLKANAESLLQHKTRLEKEKESLKGALNVLPYEIIMETEKAGYALRQYIHGSLYDRISTRPFLSMIEKKWISYQLLSGMVEFHSRHRYHGDIKTENILITSWNWAYYSDFATYKPVYLPDDNPTDFSLYFDSSTRRSCYIAPERFITISNETSLSSLNPHLNAEMDIFALGCTIAEIFLEGTPLFTLSQLLQYRKNEYNPLQTLAKIQDKEVIALISQMISLSPTNRLSAQKYLSVYREKVFPSSFYDFLYPYIAAISDPSFGQHDPQNLVFLSANSNPLVTDCDARIDQVYEEFVKIAQLIGIKMKLDDDTPKQTDSVFPVCLAIPNFKGPCTSITVGNTRGEDDPALIFTLLICSAIRNCLFPTSKLKAIDMLLVLGVQLTDPFKLDRIVPYLVFLLKDDHALVRANALIGLSQLLALVTSLTPADANIFPDYILPALKPFANDPNVLIRSAYSQCISLLAETALLFLEMSELLKSDPNLEMDGENNLYHITYDANLRDLHNAFQDQVVALLTDKSSSVKRGLLKDIPRLCIFFGKQKSNDFLISHIITYLNDSDWALRSAFCEAIVGVGTFAGSQALEQFILPLLVMALTDSEELVVEKVLNSITSLAELGLIEKTKLKELAKQITPLLIHPNRWVSYAAVGFVSSISKILPLIDVTFILYPMVSSYLVTNEILLDETALIENLKPPLNRVLYNHAVEYIADEKKSGHEEYPESSENGLLTSLRALGMSAEDKEKITSLKYYIAKVGAARSRNLKISDDSPNIIALREHSVIPHTVFLLPPDSTSEVMHRRTQSEVSLQSNPSEINATKPPANYSNSTSPKKFKRNSNMGNFDLSSPGGSDKMANLQRLSGMSIASNRSKGIQPDINSIVDGQEKHIRGLLEKKRVDLTPPTLPELGQTGKKVSNSHPLNNNVQNTTGETRYSPDGTLVAHFMEHTKAVTDLKMSPDHLFFASSSDDGSVKIWDTNRLHTNVTNRARLTYSNHGCGVKCLGFIEGRHSVASSSEKGQIHISRIEYIKSPSKSIKYTGYNPAMALTLNDDYATMMSHHDTDHSSLLLYGTKKGILTAIDLRNMKPAWSFTPSPHYGRLTSMVADKSHSWVMAGSSRGVLSLWDSRFSICVKTWQHPSKAPISNLELYPIPLQGKPSYSTSKQVCMAVENDAKEISVWDIERAQCNQVWLQVDVDEVDPEAKIDKLYGNGIEALPAPKSNDMLESAVVNMSLFSLPKLTSNRKIAINTQLKYMASGGNNRKLRFHDLQVPEKSFILSGATQATPIFNSHPYRDIYFNIEHYPKQHFHTLSKSNSASDGIGDLSSNASPQGHLDAITALTISKRPCNMVISGARDGTIKIFQ